MFRQLRQFASDDSGATLIEYGLIVSLVCIAAIGGLRTLGDSNNGSLHKTFILTIIPALK